MTVNTNTPVSGPYLTDGVNKNWQFVFRISDVTHMTLVTRLLDDSDEQVITTGFTIDSSYLNKDTGGIIVYPAVGAALPVGRKVFAVRQVPYAQPQRIGNQGAFFPQTHEDTFDLTVMQIQQLAEKAGRTLTAPVGEDPSAVVQQLTDAVAEAEGFANASASSAGASAASAAASASSASDSSDSANLANRFANENEDVPVLPGLFSAKHFMLKCQAILATISNTMAGWIHAATAKTVIQDDDEFGLADSAAAWVLKKVTAFNLLRYFGSSLGFNLVTGMIPQPNGALPLTRVDISSGVAFFSGIRTTIGALTKSMSAVWASGNNNGFLDTGAIGASKTYHIYVIRNDTTGVGDYIASLSATSAGVTAQAGWTVQPGSRIGSFLTNASSQIIPWKQYGNKVKLDYSAAEYSLTTSFNNPSFNPSSAPDGISVDLNVIMSVGVGANSAGNHRGDTVQDTTATGWANTYLSVVSAVNTQTGQTIRTTSAGLIWVRGDTAIGTCTYGFYVVGWVDYTVPRIGA